MPKTIRRGIRILIPICLLLALLAAFPLRYAPKRLQISLDATEFTETSDTIWNPYQGWYRIYGYMLSDEASDITSEVRTSIRNDVTTRLALLEINLKEYRNGAISEMGLSNLDELLSAWEDSNKQLILRFLYDWDGKAMQTEPDTIEQVMEHMAQVAAIVNAHRNCVYLMQGIFVGNHGEMNNSRYMTTEGMRRLMECLSAVVDPSIYLSVRTPQHWRAIQQSTEPLNAEDAFAGNLLSRIGLFNDGMLASGNDLGTYGDTPDGEMDSYEKKATRASELAFQDKLCHFVPNGGEVVLDNPYNDLDNALKDLAQMHVSYLNYDYDAAVLDKWKNAAYSNEGSVYDGRSGYEYIGSHLGYRYVLRSLVLNQKPGQSKEASLGLTVENVGFANSLRKFTLELLLESAENGEIFRIPVDTDARFWDSGQAVSLDIPLDASQYPLGDYRIYLSLTDDATGEEILFANDLTKTGQGYALGGLTLRELQ